VACAGCLRRGLLLRELAPRIAQSVDRRTGARARDLLALDDASLRRAVGAGVGGGGGVGELRAELRSAGCWAGCRHESDWPEAIALLGDSAPRALFGRGARERLSLLAGRPTVTLVGSRRASPYGLDVAASLGRELAAAGLPVISGMAFGIDSGAHRGALDGGGLTVAVLAAGADRPYPRARAALHREIVREGLALSELPPGTGVCRWMFPARNRLMAALAEITIVVEAAERSGSLITAEMAGDCGRGVGAVPGPVNSWRSSGTNKLLADGAAVIRDGQDVLDRLLGVGARSVVAEGPAPTPDELAVLDAVEAGAAHADGIASASGLDPDRAAASIAALELSGYLSADRSGALRRTMLPAPGGGPR
jgi:DNA processing protein